MPKKRNTRSASPAKQQSTVYEQNIDKNKIFHDVSEIFQANQGQIQIDFEVIRLVLNESNWKAEVAIDRLFSILEGSHTKKHNLAQIAHNLLSSGTDESSDASADKAGVEHSEDLRVDNSDLKFNDNPHFQNENKQSDVSGTELSVSTDLLEDHNIQTTVYSSDSLQQEYDNYIHSQYMSTIYSGELEISKPPFVNQPGLLSDNNKSIPGNVMEDNRVPFLVSVRTDSNDVEDDIADIADNRSHSSCQESLPVFNLLDVQDISHAPLPMTCEGQNFTQLECDTENKTSDIFRKNNMSDEQESKSIVENQKKESDNHVSYEEMRSEDSDISSDEAEKVFKSAHGKELLKLEIPPQLKEILESLTRSSQSKDVGKLQEDDISFNSKSSSLFDFEHEHEHEKCEFSENDIDKFEVTEISKLSVKSLSDVQHSLSPSAPIFVPRFSPRGTSQAMGKNYGNFPCTSKKQNKTVMPHQYSTSSLFSGVSPLPHPSAPSFLIPKCTPSSPTSNKSGSSSTSPSTVTPPVVTGFRPPFRVQQRSPMPNIDFSRDKKFFSRQNISTPTYGDGKYAMALQKKADPKVCVDISSLRDTKIEDSGAETAMVDKIKRFVDEGVKVMVILRGLPGSGKTTLAYKVKFAGLVLSSDDYFMKGNMYDFDLGKRPDAHQWNRYRAKKSLEIGTSPVVIDNTNTVRWEMKPYICLGQQYGYKIEIMEPSTPWKFKPKELTRRNKHGVPLAAIEQMLERYERNVTVKSVVLTERKLPENSRRERRGTTSAGISSAGDIKNCQNTCTFEKEERIAPLKKAKESGRSKKAKNIPSRKFTAFSNPFDALQSTSSSEDTDSTLESTDESERSNITQHYKSEKERSSLDLKNGGNAVTEDLRIKDHCIAENKIMPHEDRVQIAVPVASRSEISDFDNYSHFLENNKNSHLLRNDYIEQHLPQCISPIVPDMSPEKIYLLAETDICYNPSDQARTVLLEEDVLSPDKRAMIEDILKDNLTSVTETDIDKKMDEFRSFFHLMALNEEEKSVAERMAQRKMNTLVQINLNQKAGSVAAEITESEKESAKTLKSSKEKSLPVSTTNDLEKSNIEPSNLELHYWGSPVKKTDESFSLDSDEFWQCEKDKTSLSKMDNFSGDLSSKTKSEVADWPDNIDTDWLLDEATRQEQCRVITEMENTDKLQTSSHDIESEVVQEISWDQPKPRRERRNGDRKRRNSSQSFSENENPNHEHELIEEMNDNLVSNMSDIDSDVKNIDSSAKVKENMYQDSITSSIFNTSFSNVENNEKTEEKTSGDTDSGSEKSESNKDATLFHQTLVGDGKKLKQNKSKIAARFQGPFLEEAKNKFITENWSFPSFEKSEKDVDKSLVVATDFSMENNVSFTDQETSVTLSDLTILDFVNKHKRATDSNRSGLKIILSTARNICIDKLERTAEEQHTKTVERKLFVDKTTMTTELQEADATFLVNCFPCIAEDELKNIFIRCCGDVNWAVELLLKLYNLQLSAEEQIKFVEVMCKVQHVPVTPTPGSLMENPFGQVACKSPDCLLDLCFGVVEDHKMSTRKELEGQLIESGRQRLTEIESVSTLKLQRSFSREDQSTSLSTDKLSCIHGEVDIMSEVSVEEENRDLEKYISVPEKVLEKDSVGVCSDALLAVNDSYSSSSERNDLVGEMVMVMSQKEGIFQLKLPEMLARSLVHTFGTVGSNIDFDNIEVSLDHQTAQRLYQCWKNGLTDREIREKQLKEDEALAKKLQEEERSLARRERVTRSESPLRNVQRTPGLGFSLLDVSRPSPKHQPVSLKDIMAEEMAKQSDKETMKRALEATGDHMAIATRMKRKKLYEHFPGIDETLLDDLFESNCFNLEKTIEAIQGFLGDDISPPQNVMTEDAVDAYERQLVEAAKQQSLKEMLDSYLETPTSKKEYQTAEDPQYEDFRGEANIHHSLRHECFQKAQEAYGRNMREVASFYSKQGHLHTQKIKEANMRASEKILSERHYDLQSKSTLDLHGLHVDEAVAALERILPEREKEFQERPDKRKQHLIILTGKGKHSRGGIAKLRPAILKYLQKNGYNFEENQKGMFKVLLNYI